MYKVVRKGRMQVSNTADLEGGSWKHLSCLLVSNVQINSLVTSKEKPFSFQFFVCFNE